MHSHGHTQLLLQHWQRLNSGPLMPPAVHFQRHFVSFSLISQNAPTARVSTVAKCPPQDERTKIMLARLKCSRGSAPVPDRPSWFGRNMPSQSRSGIHQAAPLARVNRSPSAVDEARSSTSTHTRRAKRLTMITESHCSKHA